MSVELIELKEEGLEKGSDPAVGFLEVVGTSPTSMMLAVLST